MTNTVPDAILSELRTEIDRIDAGMHSLLMERGRIIDRLIEVKGKQGGGSAFRPGREASMMHELLRRHSGILPLDTIEGIWRIIIATFTYVQSRFSVHADCAGGDAAMRDSVRFHFGFTVPLVTHGAAKAVIDAVAKSSGDLGLIRIEYPGAGNPWWLALTLPDAPKIIARYPTIDRPAHPAHLPVFVISKPLYEAASRDVIIRSVNIDRWNERIEKELAKFEGEILGSGAEGSGLSLLLSLPGAVAESELIGALKSSGVADIRQSEIGSHAIRNSMHG